MRSHVWQGVWTRGLLAAALMTLAGCSGSSNTTDGSAPSGSSGSGSGAQSKAAPAAPPIVVPAGTVIAVTMDQSVGTKNNDVGDKFDASLAAPVTVDGKEAIPQGAKVVGHVTVSDKAGKVKGGARLAVDLDSVTVKGQSVKLPVASLTETGKGRGERTAIGAGGGAAVGAIIGAIAGGGKGAAIGAGAGAGAGTAGAVFTGNRDITIPAETKLSFKLQDDLDVPR